jgi:hypothetical protein
VVRIQMGRRRSRASTALSSSGGKPSSGCAKVVVVGFCGIFMFAGIMMALSMVSDLKKADDIKGWPVFPARVLESRIDVDAHSKTPFSITIEYEYDAGLEGALKTTQWALNPKSYASYTDAWLVQSQFPVGAETSCRVNPDDTTEAFLVVDASESWVLMVVFLLFFVLLPGGIIVVVFKALRKNPVPRAISSEGVKITPQKYVPVFFLSFTAIGAIILAAMWYGFGGVMVASHLTWQETPCRIIFSEVREHSGDDGNTYSVDILYEYTMGDGVYRSNRYRYPGGSSSGRSGKEAIVRAHRPGSEAVCYVDPDKPWMAVLRRPSWVGYLLFLIPGIFFLIGLGGLTAGRKNRDKALFQQSLTAPDRTRLFEGPETSTSPQGPLELCPSKGRLGSVIGMGIFALIMNGVTLMMFVGMDGERPPAFLRYIFLGIGLLVLWGAINQFLKLFNPKTIITIDPLPRIGTDIRLQWRMDGQVTRVRKFTITLTGKESASYRRGTDTVTDHHEFFSLELITTENTIEMERGQAVVHIPNHFMPTFEGRNNKITWKLVVTGDIPRYPDINDEYPLPLLPAPPQS